MLHDHLCHIQTNAIIATDASQNHEKAGVGIFSHSLDWSYSIRLPDFTPIYTAEFLAVVLALRKLNPSHSTVAIITDSLSLCSSLTTRSDSKILQELHLLAPSHLSLLRSIWVPRHKGLPLNECADSLAKASLGGPLEPAVPPTAYITAARFRRLTMMNEIYNSSMASHSEYHHLLFPWNRKFCPTRKLEITLTRIRCRIPTLNFYTHRAGLAASPLCIQCGEPETIDHFLLACRRFSSVRKRVLEDPLNKLGLSMNAPVLLSFGASTLGYSHQNVCTAMQNFIINSNRLPS